jgi:type IX secretion system substrate protein
LMAPSILYPTIFLVGTPNGNSVCLEYVDGEFRAIYRDNPWQVATNSPIYNVPIPDLRAECWRFDELYERLSEKAGAFTWEEGMDALEAVHLNSPWSAIYDMSHRSLYFAVHNNFQDIAFVNLEDFAFTIYVDVNETKDTQQGLDLLSNFPNPFQTQTEIEFFIPEKSKVEMKIYDALGKTVYWMEETGLDSGRHILTWKPEDNIKPGIYFCALKCKGISKSIIMVFWGR